MEAQGNAVKGWERLWKGSERQRTSGRHGRLPAMVACVLRAAPASGTDRTRAAGLVEQHVLNNTCNNTGCGTTRVEQHGLVAKLAAAAAAPAGARWTRAPPSFALDCAQPCNGALICINC